MALWRDAASWNGPQRAGARRAGVRFDRSARAALLRHHEGTDAYGELQAMIGHGARDDATFRGHVLAAMRAIDDAFYLVHPRSALPGASTGLRPALPNWLRAARDQRLLRGIYDGDSTHLLMARGPLLRGARHAAASSADDLADRFAALSVVPGQLDHGGRTIAVQIKPIPPAVSRGIPPGTLRGAETIALVPVAEAAHDIESSTRSDDDQMWIDFRPRAGLDAAKTIVEALVAVGGVDLAVAPEFIACETDADLLAAQLTTAPASARLVIGGSGVTTAKAENQPWNEARAFNSSGAELWRQRKLWPAGIDAGRAKKWGIAPPADDKLAYEDTAAGDTLTIVDADGLGRCVILICQDLQAQLMTEQVIGAFQPDWVFVPLLDTGVGANRWMHRRAMQLSAHAQTRFVVVSSTSLAAKAGYVETACALAVGPQDPAATRWDVDEIPNATQFAKAEFHGASRLALIQWRRGRWLTTRLTAE